MIKNYGKYLIIKSEEIDNTAFLIGVCPSDDDYPYICLTHYTEYSDSDSADNTQCHRFYAEALVDLYQRCANHYPKEFERMALRDAYIQGYKSNIKTASQRKVDE